MVAATDPESDPDAALVRRLLAEQAPHLAGLPVAFAAEGWDNRTFRLGEELAVRLPRRVEGVELVAHEQAWLPIVSAGLPLPTPCPIVAGRPSDAFPWPWSVVPWFPGGSAFSEPLADPAAEAGRLGRFLAALHRPAPADAPLNPYRGMPLVDRTPVFERSLAQVGERGRSLGRGVTEADVRGRWEELLPTPPWTGPALWLHGDLHPGNVVVQEGRLAAVIDWGDITSGDPATDLAAAFLIFPPGARAELRAAAANDHDPVDDATWARARAWGLSLAVAYVAGSPDGAPHIALGQQVLEELVGSAS